MVMRAHHVAAAALSCGIIMPLPPVNVRWGAFDHETTGGQYCRSSNGYASLGFPVGSEADFVFIPKKIGVHEEPIDPEPCPVFVNCGLTFRVEGDYAVPFPAPFQGQHFLLAKNPTHAYSIGICRGGGWIGVSIVADPIHDLPFNTEFARDGFSAPDVLHGNDNPYVVNAIWDRTWRDHYIGHSGRLVWVPHQADMPNEKLGYFGRDCGASVEQGGVRRFLGGFRRIGSVPDSFPHQSQLPDEQPSLDNSDQSQGAGESGQNHRVPVENVFGFPPGEIGALFHAAGLGALAAAVILALVAVIVFPGRQHQQRKNRDNE
jgi:hypothetical protein